MKISQDWSKLSAVKVNLLLVRILCNLKKYPIKEERDSVFANGKYRINGNITIEPEYDTKAVETIENNRMDSNIAYGFNRYTINGKSVPSSAILPCMLYERCGKRVK